MISKHEVFPARAGMSRRHDRRHAWPDGFPRPRGDEPFDGKLAALIVEFSPPARG